MLRRKVSPDSFSGSREILQRMYAAFNVRNQTDLGKKFEISQRAISKWAIGGTIPADRIVKTVELTGVRYDWLVYGTGPMRPEVSLPRAGHSGVGGGVSPGLEAGAGAVGVRERPTAAGERRIDGLPVASRSIPGYSHGSVKDGAGDPQGRGAKSVVDAMTSEGRYALPDGCIGVRIADNSMEPVARNGQVVVLAPASRSAVSGDIVAVALVGGGGVLFKRYFREPCRELVSLVSVNPLLLDPPILVDSRVIADMRVVIGVHFEWSVERGAD